MEKELKKKSGFAISGILYTLLLLFMALLFGVLQNLQNKKTILDQLKIETINALSCDCVKMAKDIVELQSTATNHTQALSGIVDYSAAGTKLSKTTNTICQSDWTDIGENLELSSGTWIILLDVLYTGVGEKPVTCDVAGVTMGASTYTTTFHDGRCGATAIYSGSGRQIKSHVFQASGQSVSCKVTLQALKLSNTY